MAIAASVVSRRSAIGITATAAIVLRRARRVLVVRLLGRMGGGGMGEEEEEEEQKRRVATATEIAMLAASTRSATGTTAIAAISLKLVT